MDLKDKILPRIDELLELRHSMSQVHVAELAAGTITVLQLVYGSHSTHLEQILTLQKHVYGEGFSDYMIFSFKDHLCGYLQSLRSDAIEGRIVNLQAEARGEVFGDFLTSARRALDENEKNVAAVLACAALEDSLKQCAKSHNLDVGDEEMPTVINALKSVGVISKPEGTSLKGYAQLRNKAFHAQWSEIDLPHLQSLLAFTEGFLVKHFSYQPLK